MTEYVMELAWLVETDKGSFVVVARDESKATRIANLVAAQDYGSITLIERIAGDGVFVGGGVYFNDHPDVGPDVYKFYTKLP